jgi:hypothetical protein
MNREAKIEALMKNKRSGKPDGRIGIMDYQLSSDRE